MKAFTIVVGAVFMFSMVTFMIGLWMGDSLAKQEQERQRES